MKKIIGCCALPLLFSFTAVKTNDKIESQQLLKKSNVETFGKFSFKNNADTTIEEENGIDGFASFYAKMFEGLKTANGEIFSHTKLTAASNFFPLNTLVKITNLRNGLSVLVRITDRMHPSMTNKGRVVDLSMAAAKKIQMVTANGLAKVNIQKVDGDNKK